MGQVAARLDGTLGLGGDDDQRPILLAMSDNAPADDLGLHPGVHGLVRDPSALRPARHPDRPGLDLGRCSATSRPSIPSRSPSATRPPCAPNSRRSRALQHRAAARRHRLGHPQRRARRPRRSHPQGPRSRPRAGPAAAHRLPSRPTPSRPTHPPRPRPVPGARRCWLIEPGSATRSQKHVTTGASAGSGPDFDGSPRPLKQRRRGVGGSAPVATSRQARCLARAAPPSS
jgi:hypothetical protein